MRRAKWAVVLVVCVVLAAAAGTAWPQSDKVLVTQSAYTPERLVAEFGRAVVLIAAIKEEGRTLSLGSGFVVTPDGQIVTNYHVVRDAYPALVKLTSGDIYDGLSVIDYDARRDIAVIKVKGFGLPVVRLGNSDDVKVGEQVVVIGNPQGLENTVSDGLLSGIRDSGQGFTMHQVTAPISAGSSGSPVFNSRGEVIGIATATLVEGQNLNFSVPVNYARGLIGGPVKVALKDLPDEVPSVTGTSTTPAAAEPVAVRRLVAAVTALFQAFDSSSEGLPKCHTSSSSFGGIPPHWKETPAQVDPLVYASAESLKRTCLELAEVAAMGGRAGRLADRYAGYARDYASAQNALIELLLQPPTANWNALAQRHEAALSFAAADAQRDAEEVTVLCKEVLPDLAVSLPPALSHSLTATPGDGVIGVALPLGTDSTRVIAVRKGGPADRGGIKSGDTLAGIANGPASAAQADCVRYIRAHPSQKVALRVMRDGKERVAQVTPEAYRPQ